MKDWRFPRDGREGQISKHIQLVVACPTKSGTENTVCPLGLDGLTGVCYTWIIIDAKVRISQTAGLSRGRTINQSIRQKCIRQTQSLH